jgi:hypothetical protein
MKTKIVNHNKRYYHPHNWIKIEGFRSFVCSVCGAKKFYSTDFNHDVMQNPKTGEISHLINQYCLAGAKSPG